MGKKEQYNVAVVGAMGMVGTEMIKTLEGRNFPVAEFRPLDIAENEGQEVRFNGKAYKVLEAKFENFKDIDIAIFSAGGDASEKLAPDAVKQGAVVVDNSNQWRMNPECPLVVPEVNPQDLDWHKGIIANPNCSTIQMLVALKPLHDYAKIKRVVVSTYQAVSGSGMRAFQGLKHEAKEYLETGGLKTEGIRKTDRLQLPAPYRCVPGGRLHERRVQDGERDQENPGQGYKSLANLRAGSGMVRSLRIGEY